MDTHGHGKGAKSIGASEQYGTGAFFLQPFGKEELESEGRKRKLQRDDNSGHGGNGKAGQEIEQIKRAQTVIGIACRGGISQKEGETVIKAALSF
jgi:hypothetical protein